MIHSGQFTGGVHPPNQFVPEIVSPLPCLPALVRHTSLIVYFFKELISFMGSLDKCHTSVFSVLISIELLKPRFVCRNLTYIMFFTCRHVILLWNIRLPWLQSWKKRLISSLLSWRIWKKSMSAASNIIGELFNSLPNDKISDQSNLKALADDKINVI